jgi:hypothetical protein
MSKHHLLYSLIFFLSLVLTIYNSAEAQSVTVNIQSQRDNTLYEDPSGALSNGSGYYFFAGRSSQLSNSNRRGLLRFNLGPAIPSNAVIFDAELVLFMSRSTFGPTVVELHKVTSNWGEGTSDALGEEGGGATSTSGDATWIHTFYDTASWISPGGDFEAVISSSTIVDSIGFYTFPGTPELIADVKSWFEDSSSNFGWLFIGDEDSAGSSKRFDAKESPIESNRPVLKVTYAIPS